jgi:hypothetical protein
MRIGLLTGVKPPQRFSARHDRPSRGWNKLAPAAAVFIQNDAPPALVGCFERIVIHGYLTALSRPELEVHFFRDIVGVAEVSEEALSQRTNDYQRWVGAYARNHRPDRVGREGLRKEDDALPWLNRTTRALAASVAARRRQDRGDLPHAAPSPHTREAGAVGVGRESPGRKGRNSLDCDAVVSSGLG